MVYELFLCCRLCAHFTLVLEHEDKHAVLLLGLSWTENIFVEVGLTLFE